MRHLGDVVFRHVRTHKAHIRARRGYEPTREAAMAALAKSYLPTTAKQRLAAPRTPSACSRCSRSRLLHNAPVLMTTAILHIEFFDRANQFRRAYQTQPNSGRPPEWAKYLPFYHAMELALKAYLLQQGVSQKDLKDNFGHDIKKLVNAAVKRGLSCHMAPGK